MTEVHQFNPTTLDVEKGYPARTHLASELTSWDLTLPENIEYGHAIANLHPDLGTAVEKLQRSGVDVASKAELIELSRLGASDLASTRGAEFAAMLARLRFPPGRTGLNGVGMFYKAGPSKTSDMVAVHYDGSITSVLLINSRGRWNTPGGFHEPTDKSGLDAAVRELEEETGFDVGRASGVGAIVHVLSETKTSDRTTDLAWIEAEVYSLVSEHKHLVDSSNNPDTNEEIKCAAWIPVTDLSAMVANEQLSASKYGYIRASLAACGIEESEV